MSCALCETRKERRFCPAIHGRICPQCCGEQREVTLDCPSDCPYLRQARQHEKPYSAQVSGEELFLDVEVSDQFLYEREHLLVGLSYGLARAARANRLLNDRDLIGALRDACASQQTLVRSGLHAAQPTLSAAQAAIIAEIQAMLNQYGEVERRETGRSSLTGTDTLRALVFLVRMAYSRTSGRLKSRALVDFLLAEFPETESGPASPQAAGSIVIP